MIPATHKGLLVAMLCDGTSDICDGTVKNTMHMPLNTESEIERGRERERERERESKRERERERKRS